VRQIRSLVVTGLVLLAASGAYAQGAGVRAGVSGDPTQFYGGAHYETSDIADHLRFRPNFEIGVGDDVTLFAFNVEFIYLVPLQPKRQRSEWSLYFGGGPALNLYHTDRDTDPGGGLNFLVGLQHVKGLFVELKVGALDSPGFKVGAGYTFFRR